MSINIVLEEIKGTPSSISPILGLLHNDKQILSTITKPDLNHLVSRTLNLVRSPQPYNKWCGLNLVRVICEDYAILASEGNAMLSSVMKVLESYNATIDVRILTSAIETILTPKLGSIIGHLMEYLHFAPVLALTSLQRILKFHPTTFRPFGNKLRGRLVGLMNSGEFGNFPRT
ncbi:Pre-rRNA-processing protein RIX1 [Candida viswanathii]|uniref:Pre-rRNA-processing protein RIX1 n=1 Tax=Candida viswanathii TaxID=5486 RepID=A0A367XTZ9_9ASCO|nr:Pre-rRNA-processing protein RIX1 [Candida viswanathii]